MVRSPCKVSTLLNDDSQMQNTKEWSLYQASRSQAGVCVSRSPIPGCFGTLASYIKLLHPKVTLPRFGGGGKHGIYSSMGFQSRRLRERRRWRNDEHLSSTLATRAVRALLAEVRAELVFLLFGQVGLNDFELLTLDRLSNSIDHRTTLQQEQRRSAWCDLGTHLVDEALVDPIVSKMPHESTHRGTYRQAEERDKEQQAEQHAPERATQRASPGHVAELCGLGFLGSSRPGEDSTILNLDQLLLLQTG